MKTTQKLHEIGQSLWLDNITRGLLASGTLQGYIEELSITGLTSNPTIFDHAIKNSHDYDDATSQKMKEGKSGEALFFELAIEDLRQAADLFRPIHDRTDGVDGWVSLEVSPLLARNTAGTLAAAKALHARAERLNLFIKIPGTSQGLPAIEEAIFAGVPVNVNLESICVIEIIPVNRPAAEREKRRQHSVDDICRHKVEKNCPGSRLPGCRPWAQDAPPEQC